MVALTEHCASSSDYRSAFKPLRVGFVPLALNAQDSWSLESWVLACVTSI